MIYVTRLNHSSVVLNSDLIEHIEATPDTVITLTSGQRITVRETAAELVDSVRAWRHSILLPDRLTDPPHAGAELPIAGLTGRMEGLEGHRDGGL
jgi:flagellar protein FlbD